jgi:hypothetical protein
METIGLLLLIIFSGIALGALFLLLDVFFPKRTLLAKETVESMPSRSFLLGLVNFLFVAAIFIVLFVLGDNIHEAFYFPALLILVVVAAGLIFGLSVIAQFVGERLFPNKEALQQKVWGTGLLIAACLTPFVGWVVFFPCVAIFGLGTLIGSWFPPKNRDQPETN